MNRLIAALSALPFVCAGGSAKADIPQIKHVVIVFQENRTPDNLFGAFASKLPGADLANAGFNSKGQRIPLVPVPLARGLDLDHSHAAFVEMYDHGRMDGADLIVCQAIRGQSCPPNPQFAYVNASDVTPYLEIAQHYGFANRMFQTNQGPSFPAHQFILSGTSQISATSPYFAMDNMVDPHFGAGCSVPPVQRVRVIGPGGNAIGEVFPCFEHETLPDLLEGHSPSINWRYYSPGETSIWTAPDAIHHLCKPKNLACTGSDWTTGSIVLKPVQVLTDIASGQLAAVTWIIPNGRYSDHSEENDGSGPSWVAAIINGIGKSAYWENTVILISWDDWGGWYDHVAPPAPEGRPFGYYELGFRVPLLVVSPYTPAGYISQSQHDFGSILHFTEQVFGLGYIPPGNFADSRADDLADFFDFSAKPRPFEEIDAPLPPSFFLNDTRPPLPPDDD